MSRASRQGHLGKLQEVTGVYGTLAERNAARHLAAKHVAEADEHVPKCRGCDALLRGKHLRTQFSPPDDRWHMVRTCNLHCLLDFLQDEEDDLDAGRDGEVFVAAVPENAAKGP